MVEVGLLKSPFFTHPSSHTLLHSPSSLIVGFVWKVCMFLVDFVLFVGFPFSPGIPVKPGETPPKLMLFLASFF